MKILIINECYGRAMDDAVITAALVIAIRDVFLLLYCPTGARPFCAQTPTQYYFARAHRDQQSSPFYTAAKTHWLAQ